MSKARWQRIQHLFHEALERPAEARARFLHEMCDGDSALLNEVQSLLDQPVSAERFLVTDDSGVDANDPSAVRVGQRLGVYQLQALIGRGGMGEVYRARDTRLGRDVALKILPRLFISDPDRLARFEREARVLASLNHPHIGAIYGLEDADGVRALVLELVNGETLADRIARGPIPLNETLTIARQVVDALDAAHEKSIIHRDLKPANIKVTPDGVVKVLDFGLAKAPSGDAAPADHTPSPAVALSGTREGVILGTPAYMSPEQAMGRPADKRSDIWAFGCVLYEMLTGTRAFQGEDIPDVLARILERDPDFNALPATTPPALRRLLRRSLEKDRKRRLPDIGVASLEIDEALTTPAGPVLAPVALPGRVDWRAALGGAVLAAAVAATAATFYTRRSTSEAIVTRFEISTTGTCCPANFALSPDGRRLAFVTGAAGRQQLAVRSLDQVGVQVLAGTEGAVDLFWAPDSRTICFAATSKLKRVDLSGGAPQVIADAPGFRGGTWNNEGVIVFAPTLNGGLMRVSSAGGSPVEVTHLAPGQPSHVWPQFLPDGRHVLFHVPGVFVTGSTPSTAGIYVASLDGGEPTRVVAAEQNAMYAPPGYLLRVSQGVLVAQRFDAARALLSGDPLPVAQGVGQIDGSGGSAFSVSATGILAYRSGASIGSRRQLVWFDRAGKVLGTVGQPDQNAPTSPALAPDDLRVANSRNVQGNSDIWLTDIGREMAIRFTSDAAVESSPVWSPDGGRVVFRSLRNGVSDLFVKPANSATNEQPLLVTPQGKTPLDWSRDGRFLLYANLDSNTQSDLWVLPLAASTAAADARKPFPVVQTNFDETQGQFSPDGRWLAYTSNESGPDGIYVSSFPESGGKRLVSSAGGSQPRWRPDGKELFYVAADARLMAVPIRATPTDRAVDPGTPLPLFPTRLAAGSSISLSGRGWQSRASYAVARDGRFLLNVNADIAASDVSPITVVLNWDAALKK
jgi:Tol biopolymer transport system component